MVSGGTEPMSLGRLLLNSQGTTVGDLRQATALLHGVLPAGQTYPLAQHRVNGIQITKHQTTRQNSSPKKVSNDFKVAKSNFWKISRYLKPMFCESASPRVESASRVNESSQRVGESPVSSGSKIHTVLFEFLGTFLWLWLFKCREESTSQQVHESASPRVHESASRDSESVKPNKNLNFRSDFRSQYSRNFLSSFPNHF